VVEPPSSAVPADGSRSIARRPAWQRWSLVLLAIAVAALMLVSVLLDDGRFFTAALQLGVVLAAVLLNGPSRPRTPADPGRSPWTPPVLLTVAVISGLAAALAALGLQILEPAVSRPLMIVVVLLVVADVALLVTVLVRGQLRSESWRARVFPGLSTTDRQRASVAAHAVALLLYATIVVAPWLPGELNFWVPVAVVYALAPVLLVWWVTRLASTTVGR
jgi:hypothetical protein